jgi:hypothetical protein
MRARITLVTALLLTSACEDGPSQIFEPNSGNPTEQNGYGNQSPYTPPGSASYDSTSTGDNTGRARYCSEAEMTELVQQMVVAPMTPNFSVGTIPIWDAATGAPTSVDTLFGRPEDGGFCDPYEYVGSGYGLLIWGPMDEILLWFNPDTRLVDGITAYGSYLGTLEGNYTDPVTAEERHILIKDRDFIIMDKGTTGSERKLNVYASRAEQAGKPNSWLNYDNITRIYRMIRETYFHASASTWPADFDCVAEHICSINYDSSNETVPQQTQLSFLDSGVYLVFYPSGGLSHAEIDPVRIATYETTGSIDFDSVGTLPEKMRFEYTSTSLAGCNFTLDEELTFGAFKSRCIESPAMLARASYTTYSQRDTVQVAFNGIWLGFYHPTSSQPLFKDGDVPLDTDTLVDIGVSADLMAPTAEFVPSVLAADYVIKLQALLHDAVLSPCTGGAGDNLFCDYPIAIPALATTSRRIGELMFKVGSESKSWLPLLFDQIAADYYALSASNRANVNPKILERTVLVEPYLAVVLDKFTHGASSSPNAVTRFRADDDHVNVYAETSFVQDGVPYRVDLNYAMHFGLVGGANVSRGYSEVDQIFDNLVQDIHRLSPAVDPTYYEAWLSGNPGVWPDYSNPYALNGTGVRISASAPYDRQLSMLNVTVATRTPTGTTGWLSLKTPGSWIEDNAGYYRQTAGQRFEFVPANNVYLWGRETKLGLSVEADGKIGRVSVSDFKGTVELCDGLAIQYGDDLKAKVTAWQATHTPDQVNNCNIVFNYSQNGNILDGVAGLSKRVSVMAYDHRATDVSMWR